MSAIFTLYLAYVVTWFSILIIAVGNVIGAGMATVILVAGTSLQLVVSMKPDEIKILSQAVSEGTVRRRTFIVYGFFAAFVSFALVYGLIQLWPALGNWSWMGAALFVFGGLVVGVAPALPIAYLIEKLRKSEPSVDGSTPAVRDLHDWK